MRCVAAALVLFAAVVTGAQASTVAGAAAPTTGATRGADNYRSGWYPDQTGLTPSLVAGGTFGQLFKTPVNGSVYGQPIVDDNQLLVNTENNFAYGLDPVSGAVLWSHQFGAPAQASALGCGDLAPNMGITSTPVVDQATNTEYLVVNQYLSGTSGPEGYFVHALDLTNNGAEKPGFPVQIQGAASNNPSVTFNPYYELQRPGLLLMNGVVYIAFGAHCDVAPWQGWIAGVSEAGSLTTMWTTSSTTGVSGAGIWMAGGGLVSDGPGQILFSTGNLASATAGPIPGNTPPPGLGESVVRLAVQGDGTLKPTDFFEPYDSATLDQNDIDFGSGSPVALPDSYFGTTAIPHLAVEVGKEGYVYLLNRDNLGGFETGPGGTDAVVGRYGPNGGVWSSPAVWPGDGGWVYVPTASGSVANTGSSGLMDAYHYGLDGTGKPALSLSGTSSDAFGFGSSSPVITSSGTTSGSALMWTVWSPNGGGVGAQLRAYNPVPVNGTLQMVWSAPVGTASKFNPPGVADNRMYVGSRDGFVYGFGSPVGAPLSAPAPVFPATIVGQTSTQTVTVTATAPVTVSSLTSTGSAFKLGTPSQTLPATLAAGASFTVPVTFAPSVAGPAGGGITIATTTLGNASVTLTGSGEQNGPSLTSSTTGLSFGGIPPGQQTVSSVDFANNGSQPLTFTSVTTPSAPFSAAGAPVAGTVLQPGAQILVSVTFAPTANGNFTSSLVLASNGGNVSVATTGTSSTPALLKITPMAVNYGNVAVGTTATASFTVTNVGGSSLTINKSKPPVLGPFTATSQLAEGTTILPGASLTESVNFTPSAVGGTTDGWVLNADDGQGVRTVTFDGTGVLGDPGSGGWTLNGSAKRVGTSTQLTPTTVRQQAGSAVAPALISSSGLAATFTATLGNGKASGGDGITFLIGNATDPVTSLGAKGAGLGLAGINGVAVALGTAKTPGAPSKNFVGITTGQAPGKPAGELQWVATTTKVPALRATTTVSVALSAGTLTVSLAGTQVLSAPVTVGPDVRIAFTGGTAGRPDGQAVSNATFVAAPPVTTVGDPTAGGWTLNGHAVLNGGALQLTDTTAPQEAGSAFWPTPVSSAGISATFTSSIGGGTGADGLTFVLADPSAPATSLGASGGGLGFSGVPGIAVALDTYQNAVNPSANFVGITDGPAAAGVPDQMHWLATSTTAPDLRTGTHVVAVSLVAGVLTVSIDGVRAVSSPVTVGPDVLLGFTGSDGNLTDTHSVSNVAVTAAAPSPVTLSDPTAGGWTVNGSSSLTGGALQLTPASPGYQAGTAFWPTPVSSSGLSTTFTSTIGGGTGADGLTLVLASPTTAPNSVGAVGGGLGFAGIQGIAVALDTYQNAANPSGNFVGVTDGDPDPTNPGLLHWLATSSTVPNLRATNTVTVTLVRGVLSVSVDGTQVLSLAVKVGPSVLVGFAGGTGGLTDVHAVSSVAVTAA